MNNKSYLLDSHKLLFHLDLLCRWFKAEMIYPLYISLGPTSQCNYRCIFCAYKFLDKKKKTSINKDSFFRLIDDCCSLGLKSIFFSGDGEPLLNKNLISMVQYAKAKGIDCALNTNLSLLNEKTAEEILPYLSWVRCSINALSCHKYTFIHGTNKAVFEKVWSNLESLVSLKKKKQLSVTIGVQSLALKENLGELLSLAKRLKEIGVDYFSLKPFLKHPQVSYNSEVDFYSQEVKSLLKELEDLNSKDFFPYVRWDSLKKYNKDRPYSRCLSAPFMVDVDSSGDIYHCGPHLGNSNFRFGNINDTGFKDIWSGKPRKDFLEFLNKWDVSKCMPNCRNDEVNRFLWELKHPPQHVNFI